MNKIWNYLLVAIGGIWLIQWIIIFSVFQVFSDRLIDNLINVGEMNQKMILLLIAPMLSLLFSSVILILIYFKFKRYINLKIKLMSKPLLRYYFNYFSSILICLALDLIIAIAFCVINIKTVDDQTIQLVLGIIGIIFSFFFSIGSVIFSYVIKQRIIYDNEKLWDNAPQEESK